MQYVYLHAHVWIRVQHRVGVVATPRVEEDLETARRPRNHLLLADFGRVTAHDEAFA